MRSRASGHRHHAGLSSDVVGFGSADKDRVQPLAAFMLANGKRQAGGPQCLVSGHRGTILWYQGSTREVPGWCQTNARAKGVQEAFRTIANAYTARAFGFRSAPLLSTPFRYRKVKR